ncbi:hypothetical protein KW797_03685 [Candidatus Parcubacteria bacterium]|nr:hypothetical protein [Candidatus Parcubacteria bacterium]
MNITEDPKVLLAALIGDEGPAATLFVEFAAKYGLPFRDGVIPLSTELNVMLTKWRVHVLDPQKAGFAGAIGFKRHQDWMAFFGLWPFVPQGAKQGYIMAGDHDPLIQVLSGMAGMSVGDQLCTRIRFDSDDTVLYGESWEPRFWRVVCEVVGRATELGGKSGYLRCDRRKFR